MGRPAKKETATMNISETPETPRPEKKETGTKTIKILTTIRSDKGAWNCGDIVDVDCEFANALIKVFAAEKI